MNINLISQGGTDGKSWIHVEMETYSELFIGVLAFCERYEMSLKFEKVSNYREFMAEFLIEGFDEDIELFVYDYELR